MPIALLGQVPLDTVPPPRFETRALWVATVANIDWPRTPALTEQGLRGGVDTILHYASRAGMNTIILQIRSECDAMYPSPIEPWSRALTGTQGRGPTDGFDPLQYWINRVRDYGMEIHVWFNPYRAMTSTSAARASTHVSNDPAFRVVTYGNARWLDPGHPASRTRFLRVIDDVVSRYDIDGIHIDDYFYPYPITGVPFPDAPTYAAYEASGGKLSLADWRRSNVNGLVEAMYTQTKARKPWVRVGISPFGIWRPGNPSGVTGLDAYASLYADAKKWMNEGWGDYFSPQLYWRLSSTGQPYGRLLDWWISQNTKGRHVWPGNFTSNLYPDEANWEPSEIVGQIQATRQRPGATGNVHFSAKALTENIKEIGQALNPGPYADVALVPPAPWLDPVLPPAPRVSVMVHGRTTAALTWNPQAGSEPIRRWAVSAQYENGWLHSVAPFETRSLPFPMWYRGAKARRFVVRAVDRAGNLSKPASVIPPSRRR